MRDRSVSELLAANHERFVRFVRSKVGSDAVAEEISCTTRT
jgi:DNA-directed RNA polymerase specialized sigma24 family protein